ncbi:MAG TPA: hypothetical protein VMW05_12115 [Methyloceanibacter sp.]|nr:hypothetical protein [Methyloceanibacter sp.]
MFEVPINVTEAIKRLGFDEEPGGHYSLLAAAVAFVVLERVEEDLPQWAGGGEDTGLVLARKYRTVVPKRTVVLQPRHLLTINWADIVPGFSWPVAYYVTWVPYYDRFVVTSSADCPDMFGYCDFALGAFGVETAIKDGAKEVICSDWREQLDEWNQQHWEDLFDVGLVSETEAHAWASEVWQSESDEEEDEDGDAVSSG